MTEPVCRTCHMLTLSDDERHRFSQQTPVTSVYYCEEHQRVVDEMHLLLQDMKIQGTVTGRFPRSTDG